MRLKAAQQEVSRSQTRFRVVAAGRRWGKSWLSINEMAKFARIPDQRVLYVAPTYRQAKNVIWNDLKSILIGINWVAKINESELTITLVNGSTISVRSTDNKDALRGGKYDLIVLDECAFIDPDAWFSVLRPTLSDRQGHALFITSPKGRNWIYDLWLKASSEEDWEAFQFTSLSGENILEEEIEAARRDLDSKTFSQEYEAQFVTYEGVIYYNLKDENIVEIPKPEGNFPIHFFLDFNVSPICGVYAFQHEGGVHVFDECELYSSNTFEIVQETNRRYPNRKIFAYPDASGAQRRTSANGITDHIILSNAGYTLKVGSINPAVADRLAAVNSALLSSDGTIKLTISPKCVKLINCLRKQVYKPGTHVPEKTGFDHFPDALGYGINKLYPIRKDIAGGAYAPVRRSTGHH